MKKISILAVVLASAVWAGAQSTGLNHPVKTTTAIPLKNWDTMSDTWVATDGLDRRIATHEKVGPLREGKQLAMFYFLWQGAHGQSGPHDISKVRVVIDGWDKLIARPARKELYDLKNDPDDRTDIAAQNPE